MIWEVCEGLEEGIEDFRRASIKSFQILAARLSGGDPNLANMLSSMYGGTFWSMLLSCYHYYSDELQAGGHNLKKFKEKLQSKEHEKKIETTMNELRGLELESESMNGLAERSEAYKKGSINKQ